MLLLTSFQIQQPFSLSCKRTSHSDGTAKRVDDVQGSSSRPERNLQGHLAIENGNDVSS